MNSRRTRKTQMKTIVDCHDVMVGILVKEKSPEELASIIIELTREIERLNALTEPVPKASD